MTLAPPSLWPAVMRLAGGKSWPPRDSSEAIAFIEYANRESLFPLLARQPSLPQPIVDVLTRFKALEAFYQRRYELSRDVLLKVIAIAGADQLLLLKGSDYRFRLYSEPRLRPANDIDLLVRIEQIDEITRRLALAGYEHAYSAHGVIWSRGYHEYQFAIGGMTVELHHSFVQRVRAGIRYEDVWNRREAFEGDGYRAFRLAPNDALLHHAISVGKDEFSAVLIRFVDMYLLLQQPGYDLQACVELAREWRTERYFYGALQSTVRLFPELSGPQIETAMRKLLNPRARAFLDRNVIPDPRREAGGHSRGRILQIWRKFWLMDSFWRRVAFAILHLQATIEGHLRERMTHARRKSRSVA